MLYIALFLSAIMMIGTNYAVRRSKQPIVVGAFWIAVPCFMALTIVSPATCELGVVLFALVILISLSKCPTHFAPMSLAAFVAVFGVNGWIAWRSCDRLRDEYRFESLEGRLPERFVASNIGKPNSAESIDRLESRIDSQPLHDKRERSLRQLHERAVFVFVSQPNFGSFRGMSVAEWGLKLGLRENRPISQPVSRSGSTEVLYQAGKSTGIGDGMAQMHEGSVLDFVHPNGFGYFKDLQNVAGFQSHHFSTNVDTGKQWRLHSLDLVGLLIHPNPIAYVSENLPRMDELRSAPTRDLSAFESAGLKTLRDGEELFVREMPDGSVRMLGAVRALKQCVNCHGCARGDLLGAFSYELSKQ